MPVSNSDGCCLDGLVAAILLRAAAMIAVENGVELRDRCRFDPREEFANVGAARLVLALTLVAVYGSPKQMDQVRS